MVRCEYFADRIVRPGKGVDKVEQIGQITPQNFLLERGKAEWGRSSLLNDARMFIGMSSGAGKFLSKPLQAFGRKVVSQVFHGVRIR